MRIIQPLHLLILFAYLSACGAQTAAGLFPAGPETVTWDADKLAAAATRFYSATRFADAVQAAETAAVIAPEAPETLEMAALIAHFQGREDQAFAAYMAAAASPINPIADLHFHTLQEMALTNAQERRLLALAEEMRVRHPDENMRRKAAHHAAVHQRILNADASLADAAGRMRGNITAFSIITPFDNEDGKGFASEYPPEREIDFSAEYPGTHLRAGWRTDVPLNASGQIDFAGLTSPVEMVVGYAATWVRLPQDGHYQIRVTTSDAIRLWVNDFEVLSESVVESGGVDQFIVPVALTAGWNRLLFKSCQQKGPWILGAAMTTMSGALIQGAEFSALPQDADTVRSPGSGFDIGTELERRLLDVRPDVRRVYQAVHLAEQMGLPGVAFDLSDLYRSDVRGGVFSLYTSAINSWRVGGRGDTIDVLDHLIEQNGDDAPLLYLMRAAFFTEQGRLDKARENLQAALRIHPDYRSAWIALADNYRREGWKELFVQVSRDGCRRWPDDIRMQWHLSDALEMLGRRPQAEAIRRKIHSARPGDEAAVSAVERSALLRHDYRAAIRYRQKKCALYPTDTVCLVRLGNLYRQASRFSEAATAFQQALALDSRFVVPMIQLGDMAQEASRLDEALTWWRRALALQPEDHALADRIEFISPESSAVFNGRVPSAEDIRNVLATRAAVNVLPGANAVFLLDHGVEKIKADGSSRRVDTLLMMAVNDTGRDQLTRYVLPPGRVKVLEAWISDPDGTRREAASIRDKEIRFRDLKVGSTAVLQYRVDSRPQGFLARHPWRRWFFHNVGVQFDQSSFTLILPASMKSREWGQGAYERSETRDGDHRILNWTAQKVPALIAEPASPPLIDALQQVVIAMDADWEHIAAWDRALIADAFRLTPRIRSLAADLTRDRVAPREKLDAIVRFVMREIRYQQDYETGIAGVKPYPAAVVLDRGYGDCKDKSVLVMTLAEAVGIRTEFALVRTEGSGRFIEELPWLQFDHAIVHVPVQKGIETSYFVDATPDTLDLGVLRPDVQNTRAMVIDRKTGSWRFETVPLLPAEENFTIRDIRAEPSLNPDGTPGRTRVVLTVQARGTTAASIRQVLRNADDTRVFAAQVLAGLIPAATVEDIRFEGHDDIVAPLRLSITAWSDSMVRSRDNTLVVDFPRNDAMAQVIGLESRSQPLLLGAGLSHVENNDELIIPAGFAPMSLPAAVAMDNRFFRFERTVTASEGEVKIRLLYTEKTTRIPAADYPEYRRLMSEAMDSTRQDVVLKRQEEKKKSPPSVRR